MKVCILTQQFGHLWSGVGTYATNLVAGLLEHGIEVEVICPAGMHSSEEHINIHEVPVKKWYKKVNYWLPLARQFRAMLKKLAGPGSFDIIHFTDAREAYFTPKGIFPMVGTVNDYYPAVCPLNPLSLRSCYRDWLSRWVYWRMVRLLEPRAYRKLDAVAVNSEFIAQTLTKAYRLPSDRITVVHYGIDQKPAQDPIEMEGDPSILFVGANFQRKGLPDLIRALPIIRSSYPDVMLHVVGSDKNTKAMKDLAARLDAAGNIIFHGHKPNHEVRRMRPYIFAMPSLIEGFGIVFLESMLAGIPVIGGRTGGTVELIQDSTNGFTVSPGDVQDLASKIIQLASDKSLRETFIQEGKKTAMDYSVDRMATRTIELYEKVLG